MNCIVSPSPCSACNRIVRPGSADPSHTGCAKSRGTAFGIRIVVPICDGSVRAGNDEQRDLAFPQRPFALLDGKLFDIQQLLAADGARQLRTRDRNLQDLGGAIAERNPEPGGQNDREDEYPEQDFRLAHELAKPPER